jgi:hypothetical protein
VVTDVESDAGKTGEMDAAQKDSEASPTEDSEKDEERLKTDFVVAQSSEAFIFIPNPNNHCVTMIDGVTLIDALPNPSKCLSCYIDNRIDDAKVQCVGKNPTYLGVYPPENTAIVIDKGTRHAAIIKAARAKQEITEIEVVKGANAIRFAPGGKHAVVYYDPEYVGDADQSDSNEEVTVVSIKNLESGDEDVKVTTNMLVGARPRDIVFQNNGEKVFFVTDDGISELDFNEIDKGEASTVAVNVTFKGRLDPAKAQIAIAPGGRYATGFEPGSDELFLLDITSAKVETAESVYSLSMDMFFRETETNGDNGNSGGTHIDDDDDAGRSSPVYDFEEGEIDPRPELPEDVVPSIGDVALSPTVSGLGSFAMVTIPNPGLVLKMTLDDAFTTSKNVLDEVEFYLIDEKYDRVIISKDGEKSWLFNQAERSLQTVLLDLTGDAPPAVLDEDWPNWAFNHIKYIRVASPISRVETLNSDVAVVAFHEPTSSLVSSDRGTGYTIINFDEGAQGFRQTPKPIQSYVTYDDALFAKMEDDPDSAHQQIFRTGLKDLLSRSIELKAKPNAIGVMDGDGIESIFVSHEHPDGHIILLNEEGEAVTNPFVGFQIANRVQE